MLGKDFVSGLIALWFFMTRTPCRVVTTSADYSQLSAVLWGEIGNFIGTAAMPLTSDKGGPLVMRHLNIGKIVKQNDGSLAECEKSYLMGRVAAKGEGLLGHHIAELGDGIPRTMAILDEASGCDDDSYERMSTWARRILAIGNPYSGTSGCTFFERYCEAGNVLDNLKPKEIT